MMEQNSKAISWGLVFVGDFWWILRNIKAMHLAPAAFVILLPGNCSTHGFVQMVGGHVLVLQPQHNSRNIFLS